MLNSTRYERQRRLCRHEVGGELRAGRRVPRQGDLLPRGARHAPHSEAPRRTQDPGARFNRLKISLSLHSALPPRLN